MILFQNSPQPTNQVGSVANQNQALYTDPRGKAAGSAIGVDECGGNMNDLVNLNNKRFSDDLNQMTPQQDGKAHHAGNDRMRLKGQHAGGNYQIH